MTLQRYYARGCENGQRGPFYDTASCLCIELHNILYVYYIIVAIIDIQIILYKT